MINQLTFTRFIAALIIVIFHFGRNLFKSLINIPNFDKLWDHLNLGVSFFFVLSGFVMTIAYKKDYKIDKIQYYINRFSRIYPLHLLTLFFMIILAFLFSINYLDYYHFPTSPFLKHLFLIQAWFPSSSLSLNVPSWSISVELFFYLLFPFIIYVVNKISLRKIILIVLLIFIISQLSFNLFFFSPRYEGFGLLKQYFLSFNPLFHLNSFLVKQKNYDVFIISLVIVTIITIYILKDLFLHNGMLSINFAIIILLLSLNTGRITDYFSLPILIHLGNISFAIYLLHFPIYTFFYKFFSFFSIKRLM